MRTTPTEDDLTHLRHNPTEDPYFVTTRYINLPFIVVQSFITEKYYKLDLDGKYLEPRSTRSANPTEHGVFDIMEILT